MLTIWSLVRQWYPFECLPSRRKINRTVKVVDRLVDRVSSCKLRVAKQHDLTKVKESMVQETPITHTRHTLRLPSFPVPVFAPEKYRETGPRWG